MDLEGESGRFTARLRQYARFVDLDKCTSCGECARVCPINISDKYNEGLSDRKAIFKQYPQAIPGAFAIAKRGTAPCRVTCPAHVSVQGFIALTNEGKYREALELFKKDHPFPGICGRVCHHPCEGACTRNGVDQPLAIQYLHRFLADWEMADEKTYIPEIALPKNKKVAIIGAGPAGLSCAYFLAVNGYKVMIFEKLPVLGGMLMVGIPSYRLPRNIIETEIQVIKDLGVEFTTGVEIGKDITIEQLRKDGYSAFFMGIGAHKCKNLGVEGENLEGVLPGVDFLREFNLGNDILLGHRVAVIGGGNVAMDSVRTALRMGSSKPFVLYRRSYEEMPANEIEIEECNEEGIEIMTLTAPVRIIGEGGRVKAVECICMELGEPDGSGRRRPVPVKGSEFVIEVDTVIPAIGQESDWGCLTDECECTLSNWGTMNVNSLTLQTNDPDIFAGGDAVTGPATVVEAVGAGKEAAISIDRFIQGEDITNGRKKEWQEVKDVPVENVKHILQQKMLSLPPDTRMNNFDEVQLGFDESIAAKEAGRCLECGICSECYQCVDVCLAKAVDHDQIEVEKKIEVGSVVLAPGSRPFDPSGMDPFYHYQTNPNVLTSLEFERLLSASGPTMGHLIRPSDEKEPKKIAWLQCVGSRDTNHCNNGYCSSVCCMYAIKDAMIAKEHAGGDMDCVIFNMDIRTFGKEYEKYYNRAREKEGVRFIKARVHTIDEVDTGGGLRIRYADDGEGCLQEEIFDMVVLSVGLQITESVAELAGRLEVELDQYNFAVTKPFLPVQTSRPGVYVCGVLQGPKDIPSSVIEASAAACLAGGHLSYARGTQTRSVEIPEEMDVADQEPRVGVFVCDCGINIAGVVDVPATVEYAKSLGNVVFAAENLFTCSQDSQEQIKEIIKEHSLNRIVVAACTPKTHEGIFMDTLEACGLNKYLFEMANIRNQNSWVHSGDPEKATEKAKNLVKMAVARATTLSPLNEKTIPVNPRALIIGGGVAGMNASLGLADQGFEVVLIEKETILGGMANQLTETIDGENVGEYIAGLTKQVGDHEKIQVLLNSLIVGFSGFKGNFTTEVLVGPGMYERKIDHGVVILATGATEYQPKEYLYGQNEKIMTQVELAQRIKEKGAADLSQVVMIQCIGSRNEKNPNCSRICCQTAIKNALHIKKDNPDAEVYVLYRDIRTYGLFEDYYTRARSLGVMFFRYETDDLPLVEKLDDGVSVTFKDHVLGRYLKACPDLVVLSAGMVPEDTEELASIIKLARTEEGYFMEAHAKLKPVDMTTEGIFVCGTAHSPKLLSESISQAYAAAARATTFLSQTQLKLSGVIAQVDPDNCTACLICVRSCPYGVPKINAEGVSEIDVALCQGCGVCTAECPAKAIELAWYEDEQLLCKVESLLEGVL